MPVATVFLKPVGTPAAGEGRDALAFEAAEAQWMILRLKDARQRAWEAALPLAPAHLAKLMRYESMLSNRRDKALRELEFPHDPSRLE